MAMRPLKSTTIQFGMVVMPVKIYPATQDKSVGMFNQIHAACGSRIKMPKTCPKCNRPVEAGEMVKGYSLGKVKGGEEKFIYITDQELENMPLETAQNIAIDAFVPAEKIADPRWLESCYFLSPEDTAVRPFVLFARTMENINSVGVAKVALKEQKEHLCIVRPFAGMLMLQTLHWADELRDYSEIMVSTNVTEKEMELAKSLITAMTKEVDLASYQDEYRKAMLELIAAKQAGRSIAAPVAPKPAASDMVEALLASLKAVGAGTS
jgi:DNA end-binding protein Ku